MGEEKTKQTKNTKHKSFYFKNEKKEIKDKIIKDNWTPFEAEEEKTERKKLGEKKEISNRLIKDQRYRKHFEQVEKHY